MVWAVRDYEFLGRPGKKGGVSYDTGCQGKSVAGEMGDANEDGH